MPLNFDFEGVPDQQEPLPIQEPGDYVLTITAVDYKKAKEGAKSPYDNLYVKFSVDGTEKGRTGHNFHLSPDFMWQVKQFIQSVFNTQIDGPISIEEKDLIGQKVGATLAVKPRNDNPDLNQNTCEAFFPAG